MKKKIAVLTTLVVALLGTLVLINNASAQTPQITLQLLNGNLSCGTYPTSVGMWSLATNTATGTMPNDTWVGNIACNDASAEARPASITLDATTTLTNGTTTIPDSYIAIDPNGSVVNVGWSTTCISNIAVNSATGTLAAAFNILSKSTSDGTSCSFLYTGSNMDLTVTIPAYQQAGSYTGTLTIAIPTI